jgi:hypothetical protein
MRETSAVIAAARHSYPVNFPRLAGGLNAGSWLIIVAIGVLAVAAVMLGTGNYSGRSSHRRSTTVAVGSVAVIGVTAACALLLATQQAGAVDQTVARLQTTATESTVLLVAEHVWSQCFSNCTPAAFPAMERDDSHFPEILYVGGDDMSRADGVNIAVSIGADKDSADGQTRVGLAAMSDSGVCVLLLVPDASARQQLYGTTTDPDMCLGSDALVAADSPTPELGGWVALEKAFKTWPTGNWAVGGGPIVYSGV